MNQFSSRPVNVIQLPLSKGVQILHPEQTILRFGDIGSVDMGSLCYLHRDTSVQRKRNCLRHVDLQSFDHKRAGRVRDLILHVSDAFANGGRRAITQISYVRRFMPFMDWADAQGHHNILNNEPTLNYVIRQYVEYIRDRVSMNSLHINSGSAQQRCVIDLLGEFLNESDLKLGLNLIRKSNEAAESTKPPCEEAQAKVLSLCEALFDGLTELVLDLKPYPFRVEVPKYLDWAEAGLWIFPTTRWYMSPHNVEKRHSLGNKSSIYDYTHGRLTTKQELISCGYTNAVATRKILLGENQLAAANKDPQCIHRRFAGMLAHNTFLQMFIAQTGMNWSQAVSLPWSKDYEVEPERQVFRTIKWRAGNKKVSFEIPLRFLDKFKRFLSLRDYLLNGVACDSLFFYFPTTDSNNPKKINYHQATTLFMTLQKIDPTLPKVLPREWRAAKSDWLIRNTDPSTAALVLQSSEKTVLSHYAAGSETTQLEEMSAFFDGIADVVIPKGQVVGADNAVGVCSSFGSPHQVSSNTPIVPDCRGPEGCLFCDKFKVHADERDTRKLLSCQYCVNRTSHLIGSEEQFRKMLKPILDRIQMILNEITNRDVEMVQRITKQVNEEGELDPYWAAKLEMLINLELAA